MRRLAAPVCFLLLISAAANAQTVRSWLAWRTVETPHFAFHYPLELEDWTRSLAARIEAIDSAVASAVGYRPDHRIDVVVDDPYEMSNGAALPFLNSPVITLWATPPDPQDEIGEYRSWNEMVASHEFAHMAHLLRPSRNAFSRTFWSMMPVVLGPLSRKSPEWVIEGYATYIEGQVTGSGRPHGVWGPALIRQLALEGRIPSYSELDGSGAFEGGAFRYLIGSAFLDWLTRRPGAGDSSLVHLWRRLSARQNRGFDEAFQGVFGEAPAILYGRFTAEVTANATTVHDALAQAGIDTGDIVQRLARETGRPAFSNDGRFVAVPIAIPGKASRIVVWSSAVEPDATTARRDSALLRADAQDVPAVRIYPTPKKAKATLPAVAGLAFQDPRFLSDGRILTWRLSATGDGSLASDLYLWNWEHGGVERVTGGDNLQQPDPAPSGQSAAAIRCRGGHCDVVWVNLASGGVSPIATGDASKSYYHPRVSADGRRIIVSVNADGVWRLVVMDTLGEEIRSVGPHDAANRYDAEWIGPNEVVEVTERGGIPNIAKLELSTASERFVTRVTGAAIAPAPNPKDTSVWFLSLYAGGYDLRRVRGTAPNADALPVFNANLRPVVQTPPEPREPFATAPIPASRSYETGPRLFRWIPAAQSSVDGTAGTIGLVSADVIGRSELMAKVALGDTAAWRGEAIDLTWRGALPTMGLQLFRMAKRAALASSTGSLSLANSRFTGAEPWLDFGDARELNQEALRIGGAFGNVLEFAPGGGGEAPEIRRLTGFLHGATAHEEQGLDWQLRQSLTLDAATMGMDQSNQRHAQSSRLVAKAELGESGALPVPLNATFSAGELSWTGDRTLVPYDLFTAGGLPPSLADGALFSQQITAPALPAATDSGHKFWSYRLSTTVAGLTPYVWGAAFYHDVNCVPGGGGGSPSGCPSTLTWQRVIGAEWSLSIPRVPIAGTPPARALIGVGRSIDPPLQRKLRGYLSLILDP